MLKTTDPSLEEIVLLDIDELSNYRIFEDGHRY